MLGELKNTSGQAAGTQQADTLPAALLDAVVNGMILLDENGRIRFWNRWMETASGVDRAAALGRPLTDLFPALSGKRIDRAIQEALQRGSPTLLSQSLNRDPLPLHRPGQADERIEQMIYITPLHAAPDGTRGCLIQVHDVTPAVRREQLLRETTRAAESARSKAEELSRLKSGFISTVSHELRTPLTSIRGSIGLIAGGATGELPAQADQLIRIALKNTERLLVLINDILDIEKIEAGRIEFHFQPLPVCELLDSALEANAGYAEEYGIYYRLRGCGPGLRVQGDQARLLQVMNNLLSNAAKYSPPGGEVTIAASRDDKCVRVTVTDQGPGVPAAFRARLFEKFSQADVSDARRPGGTGLGLSIARAIVLRHGGTIDLVDNDTPGTTFYFTLPLLAE